MSSYFKTVKSNVFHLLWNCDTQTRTGETDTLTKKELVNMYLYLDNSPEHTQDKKLYNNISQALNRFKKLGLVESPARASYRIAPEAQETPYEEHLKSQKDIVSLEFVKHSNGVQQPVKPQAPTVEERIDEVVNDEFYWDAPENLKHEELTLQVVTAKGEVLIDQFLVARDKPILSIQYGGLSVAINMNALKGDDPAVKNFIQAAVSDFNDAPSAPYAAERVCKILMVCAHGHNHQNPLGGLLTTCPSNRKCPVNDIFSASIVRSNNG